MLYAPAQQNYRCSSQLIGGHSGSRSRSGAGVGGGPAGLSRSTLESTRAIPQFTLKTSSGGIGTHATRQTIQCKQQGDITREMTRSHWNTKHVDGVKFNEAIIPTRTDVTPSTIKPQQVRHTSEILRQQSSEQHAGVSTAFADPIQRQQHHPTVDKNVKLDKHYETSAQRSTPLHSAAARQRVQPSLTFKTHNPSKISDSYTTQSVPITDTLASHFTIGHHSTSTASSSSSSSYETTSGSFHRNPRDQNQVTRSAGAAATHAPAYDVISHRTRVNSHISPFEHYSADTSVRRAIPKSSQHSYNIVTGEERMMGSV